MQIGDKNTNVKCGEIHSKVQETDLENTDQELCERVEGFEENLVLQIQSVPSAVWTPLYQSAFYVLAPPLSSSSLSA